MNTNNTTTYNSDKYYSTNNSSLFKNTATNNNATATNNNPAATNNNPAATNNNAAATNNNAAATNNNAVNHQMNVPNSSVENTIKTQNDINTLPLQMNNNNNKSNNTVGEPAKNSAINSINNNVNSSPVNSSLVNSSPVNSSPVNSSINTNKPPTEPVIDTLLNNVMELPVSNNQKIKMLNILRENIQRPDMDEERRFKEIENKYLNVFAQQQQQIPNGYGGMNGIPMQQPQPQMYGMQGMQPGMQQGMPGPYGMNAGYGMQQGYMHHPPQYNYNPFGMGGYMMNPYGGNSGTLNEYHFQILKDGLDVIRTEIIDLMRHLKDYTQRYMANTRESDMEKITDYIDELMNINKNLEQAKVVAEDIKAEDNAEAAEKKEEESKGIMDKAGALFSGAVSGVKNAVGSVGDIISTTVKAANNVLAKPVIGGDNTEEQPPQTTNATTNTSTNTVGTNANNANANNANANNANANKNKNMVDVNDYMKSNSRTDFEPSYRPNEYLTNNNINVNAEQVPHFTHKSINSASHQQTSEQPTTLDNNAPNTPATNMTLSDTIKKVNSSINKENMQTVNNVNNVNNAPPVTATAVANTNVNTNTNTNNKRNNNLRQNKTKIVNNNNVANTPATNMSGGGRNRFVNKNRTSKIGKNHKKNYTTKRH